MLYTQTEINENPLYNGVMVDINKLHDDYNCPTEFDNGETRKTTTGNYISPFWNAITIGDWDDGKEVVDKMNEYLDTVHHPLGLMGNGGITHFYRSEKWTEFVIEAKDIIDDFHNENAFEKLQLIK